MGKEDGAIWDIAGFTSLASQLGKRVPSGEVSVPSGVRLTSDGAFLEWPWKTYRSAKSVKPGPAMFAGFVRLWDAEPDKIRAFAEKWGCLNVLENGSFASEGRFIEGDSFAEPIEAWRYFSRRAEAVLSIAAALRQKKKANPADWCALSSLTDRMTKRDWARVGNSGTWGIVVDRGFSAIADQSIETQQAMLWAEINLWMKLSGLALVLGCGDNPWAWRIEISYEGHLLAAVALQIALTVCGTDGPSQCSGCGRLYYRAKAAKRGQDNFCEICGREESVRRADSRRRQKIGEARRLHGDGLNLREIAKKLKVRSTVKSTATETVRRWIEKGK